jgi:membrane associated rhomboid family serine protease
MEGVREYLLSVTAGAMLCGILGSLIGEKGNMAGLYWLISGLFLCFLVIAPLADISVSEKQFPKRKFEGFSF